MMKISAVKVILFSSFFLFSPLALPCVAQNDDPFEMEADDWSDDMLDEDPILEEEPPPQKTEKKDVKNEEELPEFYDEEIAEEPVPPPPPPAEKTASEKSAPPPDVKRPQHTPMPSKPKMDFKPVTPSKPKYAVSDIAKRAGPPMVLVARPVYAPYSNESKTKYISAITEAYYHFKLGALPNIQVVPIERIANNVQYFRDFSRRISRTTYIDAAKKLGATYLCYQEYDPKGKKIKFSLELFSLADNKKLVSSIDEIELSDFENGLAGFVKEVAEALIGTIPEQTRKFLATPVLSGSMRAVESLGNTIVSMGDYSQKRAEAVAPQLEKAAKGRDTYLAKFVAVEYLAKARMFDRAIALQQSLNSAFTSNYPALKLRLAALYRMEESYDDALVSAENAASDPSLTLLARIEKARIYEAKGDLRQAKREYESVLSEGGEDGEIYFQLALVSIGLNNLSQAQDYLKKAAGAGRALDRGDYFDLGLRYEALGTATEQAITAFQNSLGMQQDNEEAWQKLADIYSASGNRAEAAQCYVSLFHINNSAYKDYLAKAGKMFEEAGYLDNAKDAYALFLARRFSDTEVTVRLAKLELNSGNCKKAIELVDEMETTGEFGEDVAYINTTCGKEERRVVIPTGSERDKGWRARFLWRVGSGAVVIAGVALGAVFDSKIGPKQKEYDESQNTDVVNDLHSELETLKRNSLLCYAGAGVGGASFALSIVLPIVFSK